MAAASRDFDQNVFLNCPFDSTFKPLFDAAIFAVQIAGFTPHCSLEARLELGLDLGCRRYGRGRLADKRLLVLDSKARRYQSFISDIAGQDIASHSGKAGTLIRCVRDWLSTESKNPTIPGGAYIFSRYRAFREDLPDFCRRKKLTPGQLTFGDFSALLFIWLAEKET